MTKTVIFIDKVHFKLQQKLVEQNFNYIDASNINKDNIVQLYNDSIGIVIRSRFSIDSKFISAFPNLKFIARFGAGMENIDVDYARSKNIACFRAPEGNMTAVAEQAIGMLLALSNNLFKSRKEVQAGIWKREENRGWELEGKTVGIIGFGFMGSALHQRLLGFGCKILVHDKYKTISNKNVKQVSLAEIQQQCDIISLHLPQSEETIGYVDSSFIKAMEKPFVLINTARGKHVVSEDLLTGLNSGKVIGACLDVLDKEKPSFENTQIDATLKDLLSRENVIITPHIAGWTQESNEKMADSLLRQILDLKLG